MCPKEWPVCFSSSPTVSAHCLSCLSITFSFPHTKTSPYPFPYRHIYNLQEHSQFSQTPALTSPHTCLNRRPSLCHSICISEQSADDDGQAWAGVNRSSCFPSPEKASVWNRRVHYDHETDDTVTSPRSTDCTSLYFTPGVIQAEPWLVGAELNKRLKSWDDAWFGPI